MKAAAQILFRLALMSLSRVSINIFGGSVQHNPLRLSGKSFFVLVFYIFFGFLQYHLVEIFTKQEELEALLNALNTRLESSVQTLATQDAILLRERTISRAASSPNVGPTTSSSSSSSSSSSPSPFSATGSDLQLSAHFMVEQRKRQLDCDRRIAQKRSKPSATPVSPQQTANYDGAVIDLDLDGPSSVETQLQAFLKLVTTSRRAVRCILVTFCCPSI